MFSKDQVEKIEKCLGYKFKNDKFLNMAFTHSSYANLYGEESYERLEFLGDSVLHFSTTNYLFSNFILAEGVLSKLRSFVVSTENLSNAIDKLNIEIYIKYGKHIGKKLSKAIKADLFEAILGAIYLDSNFAVANSFVKEKLQYSKELFEILIDNSTDYKTKLQEVVQAVKTNVLVYKIIDKKGSAHAPEFTAEVILNDKILGIGTGKTKKSAENLAAFNALKTLG